MSWTPEREKKLKELWKTGHSASQIANMLGETTRNAVIGKAHRLNLEARAVSRKLAPKVYSEKETIETITLDLNHLLEKLILKNPDQWIWSHNRWK